MQAGIKGVRTLRNNNSSKKEYKDKFIGFVDILGWKEKVKSSETGTGNSLDDLLKLSKELGTPQDKSKFEKYGPIICPCSKYIKRNLDFEITRISDCVIVSTEISPAGVINLINHCWAAVIRLLTKGIMCRGYITRGMIYHNTSEPDFIGSGYQKAYEKEHQVTAFKCKADEIGTPFVEVDPVVCNYIRDCIDKCVREMFSRFVEEDGKVTALFPFKRLEHSFVIGDWMGQKFDPERELRSNENTKLMILRMKENILSYVDQSNHKAVSKAQHYINALDRQLGVCQKTEELIKQFMGKL